MTLLAGCDFVLELSYTALLKQLRSTPFIGGTTLQAPFELTIPGQAGSAHLMIDAVEVDINGDDTLTIKLICTRSSVTSTNTPPVSIYPISGTITLKPKIALVSVTPSVRSLVLNFSQCPVTDTLTPGIPQLTNGIRAYIQGLSQAVLRSFTVRPGTDGTLLPLAFRTLRLRCFGPADRNLQGVALFGNFFADTQDAGNLADRQVSAVPAGRDVLTALSLRSFKTFQFCPAIAKSLAKRQGRPQPLPLDELPGGCGPAGSIEMSGVTVNSIDAVFGQGRVEVYVGFHKSGTCYEASGAMASYVRFATNGTDITSTMETLTPNVDVEVDFLCQLAGIGLLGLPGSLVIISVEDALADVAKGVASTAFASMSPQSFASPLPGVLLEEVAVTPEEFSVVGKIPSYQAPTPTPDLSLNRVDKSAVSPRTKSGVWNTKIFCKNEAKNYPYSETLQTQSQKYRVVATLIPLPISVVYSVRGGNGPWQRLDPGASSVTLSNLECRYPTPLSAGGSVVVRDVTLLYTLNGNEVILVSQDGQGNFGIDLRAEVSDASGQPPVGVDPAPKATLGFESDIVVMGPEYVNDLKECFAIVKAINDQYAISKSVPRWKQVLNPVEVEVLGDLDFLDALGTVVGEDMARHYRNAYGGARGRHQPSRRRKSAALPGSRTPASPSSLRRPSGFSKRPCSRCGGRWGLRGMPGQTSAGEASPLLDFYQVIRSRGAKRAGMRSFAAGISTVLRA